MTAFITLAPPTKNALEKEPSRSAVELTDKVRVFHLQVNPWAGDACNHHSSAPDLHASDKSVHVIWGTGKQPAAFFLRVCLCAGWTPQKKGSLSGAWLLSGLSTWAATALTSVIASRAAPPPPTTNSQRLHSAHLLNSLPIPFHFLESRLKR